MITLIIIVVMGWLLYKALFPEVAPYHGKIPCYANLPLPKVKNRRHVRGLGFRSRPIDWIPLDWKLFDNEDEDAYSGLNHEGWFGHEKGSTYWEHDVGGLFNYKTRNTYWEHYDRGLFNHKTGGIYWEHDVGEFFDFVNLFKFGSNWRHNIPSVYDGTSWDYDDFLCGHVGADDIFHTGSGESDAT